MDKEDRMDTRLLQTFLLVNDLGSFTKAASELGYAQSTVTAQIHQLEEELGYFLFDRLGKKIYLTELGKQFLPYAEGMLQLTAQARQLGKADAEIRGSLRVGVLESLLFSTLTEVLPRFKARFPLVELQVKMGRAKDLLRWLKENELDMVYYSHDLNRDPELVRCYCRRETLTFVAHPDHPLTGRPNVSLKALLEQPVLTTERSGLCFQRLQHLAADRGLRLQHAVEVDNTKAISDLVSSGMGCSFLPRYAILSELASGRLAEVFPDVPEQTYFSQIVCHRDKWIAPYQTALLGLIREHRPEAE